MIEGRRGLGFAEEAALVCFRVRISRHHLQRDGPPEALVDGFVHCTHSALSDLLGHDVAVDVRSGREDARTRALRSGVTVGRGAVACHRREPSM